MADVVTQWFNLLADGRLDDADAILSGQAAASLRPPSPSPGEKPVPEEQLRSIEREKLRSDPLVRFLTSRKKPLTVEMAPAKAPPVFDEGRATLDSEFTVSGAGDKEVYRVTLRCLRYSPSIARSQPWRIERWAEALKKTGDSP